MKKLKFEKNPKMLCPCCKKPLVEGKSRVFETLADHVSDPNNEQGLPARETWECGHEYCALYKNSFWDWYGDFYSKLHHRLTRALAKDLGGPYEKSDSLYALNSYCLKHHMDTAADWNGFVVFHLGFWRWKLYIGTQHNLMGEKVALGRIKLKKQHWDRNGWSEGATFWSGIACYFQFLKDVNYIKKNGEPKFRLSGWKEVKVNDIGPLLGVYHPVSFFWKKEQHWKGDKRNGYRLAYWLMNTFHSEWMEEKSK